MSNKFNSAKKEELKAIRENPGAGSAFMTLGITGMRDPQANSQANPDTPKTPAP